MYWADVLALGQQADWPRRALNIQPKSLISLSHDKAQAFLFPRLFPRFAIATPLLPDLL